MNKINWNTADTKYKHLIKKVKLKILNVNLHFELLPCQLTEKSTITKIKTQMKLNRNI